MTPREAIPAGWVDLLEESGPIALGHDIGTTEKGTSNPSALAVMQRVGRVCRVPLLVAWKTKEPRVSTEIIAAALDGISSRGLKARRLCVDFSSEKFFGRQLRQEFASRVPVALITANEKLKHRGHELDAKTLLGNLYTSLLEDGLVELPPGDWIRDDHRLVMRESGGFAIATGKNGQHGDTYIACGLAYWGIEGAGGPAQAAAVPVGSFSTPAPPAPWKHYRKKNGVKIHV